MRHENLPPGEPWFEAPPRLAMRPERRLTARVAGGASAAHQFRENALTLAFFGDAVTVVATGDAVAAGFGIAPGQLTRGDDDLSARLLDACAALRAAGTVVGFEAAVATPSAACVLLRGIMLPVHGGAEAVLSWKQVLGDDATARLRAELLQALRTPRAAVADAFASSTARCLPASGTAPCPGADPAA